MKNSIVIFCYRPEVYFFLKVCFKNQNCWTWNLESRLKSDSHLPKKITLFAELKALKSNSNALYFILKALFVLKIFKFLSWLFGHVEKMAWLERLG